MKRWGGWSAISKNYAASGTPNSWSSPWLCAVSDLEVVLLGQDGGWVVEACLEPLVVLQVPVSVGSDVTRGDELLPHPATANPSTNGRKDGFRWVCGWFVWVFSLLMGLDGFTSHGNDETEQLTPLTTRKKFLRRCQLHVEVASFHRCAVLLEHARSVERCRTAVLHHLCVLNENSGHTDNDGRGRTKKGRRRTRKQEEDPSVYEEGSTTKGTGKDGRATSETARGRRVRNGL